MVGFLYVENRVFNRFSGGGTGSTVHVHCKNGQLKFYLNIVCKETEDTYFFLKIII
jgi:hypothetical protein